MFSEPFFEAFFDHLGWNTENWAAPVLQVVRSVMPGEYFFPHAMAFMGIEIGVWLHHLATGLDRRNLGHQNQEFAGLGWSSQSLKRSLQGFLENPQSKNRKIRTSTPSLSISEVAKLKSFFARLRKHRVKTPFVSEAVTPAHARILVEYIERIEPFTLHSQRSEARMEAKMIVPKLEAKLLDLDSVKAGQ